MPSSASRSIHRARLTLCRLSLALVPIFLSNSMAQEVIELPSNLSPALKDRLLAQNNAAQPEEAAEAAQPDAPQPEPETQEEIPPAEEMETPPPPVPAPAVPPAQPFPAVPPVVPPTPPRLPGTPPTGQTPARVTLPGRGALPASTTANVPPDDPNDFTLAFAGAPIEDVIQEYERISNRHVIRDNGLAGNVVVVQNPNRKMTREEGVDFIKASLLMQGFSLQEYRPGIDKIINITVKSPLIEPSLSGAPIYMSAEELPETDQPVNYLIRLNYLSAQEASPVLAAAVPTHAWGLYTAIPSANAILVRGAVPNIRTLIKIKDEIDIEPVKTVHEFVELERASAEDVQALLEGILQAQTQASAAAGGATGFRPVAPQLAAANLGGNANPNQPAVAGAGTSSGVMPDGKSVIVKADPRTNRIFINGPQVHVTYLKRLVKEFDQPSKVKNLLTQQLRYIPVDDFLDIAAASLEARGLGAAGQTAGGGAGGAAAGGRNTAGQNQFGGGNRGGFGGGFGGGARQAQFGGGGGGAGGAGGFGGASTGSGLASRQSTTALPRSTVVGKTLLISDPRMNSLLVTGPPESIERVSELIKEMDKRPLQVHINAVIAQITLGDTINTGIDLLRRVEDVQIGGQNVSIAGLYSSTGGRTFLDPANLDTVAGFTTSATGLNIYATVGELFNAYVTALEQTNRFKVLSKPNVATANNETALIEIGERRPIPANTQTSLTNNGATISNIEYEDIVLSLEVRALVNSKNEITVEVVQVNDNVTGNVQIGENLVPIISTQTLNTKITVPNGGIFHIGGTISEQTTQTVTGLPFISRVPIIKHLFGSTTHNTQRRELVVMIQPRIIDSAVDMVNIHASEVQSTIIGPEAENFAKPARDTSDVLLPTYEKDIPFDSAGYPVNQRPFRQSIFNRVRQTVAPK